MPRDRRDQIGLALEELDTPALCLDGRASQRNLRKMAEFFDGRACRLRPHFKNHKCATLARRQEEAGNTVGFTCAKLGEAEALAQGGIRNILIANQVVGARKVGRLVELAGKAEVTVAVDHIRQAEAIAEAAAAADVQVGVLVEVDIGMGRCGTGPGQPALDLARQVRGLTAGIVFRGIQAYEGHTVYTNDVAERSRCVRESVELAVETRRLLEADGIPVGVISGGATSTYQVTAEIEGVDEIQAGTYATMDWRYAQLAPEFEVALSVLARVISKRPGEAVLDVGAKGTGNDFGLPKIRGYPEVETRPLSEEHCTVHNVPDWELGQTIHLLPSHACTTCNLYREMIVHEDDRVTDVWPIEGSGKLA